MLRAALSLAAALLALSACGGSPQPSTPTPLALTEANALTVLSEVWLDNETTSATEALHEAGPLLTKHLPLVALQPSDSTIDVACAAAGKLTLTGSVADPQQPGWTVGDRVTATWLDCREAMPPYAEVVSGRISLQIVATAAGTQTFSVTYDGYRTAIPDLQMSFTVQGRETITRATSGATTTITLDAAELTGNQDGAVERKTDVHLELVDSGEAFRLDFAATAVSARWGGALVRYSTPVAFTGQRHARPATGQLLLQGADDATARVTALDAATVQVDLDLDGDGAVDPGRSTTMTWQRFEDGDDEEAP